MTVMYRWPLWTSGRYGRVAVMAGFTVLPSHDISITIYNHGCVFDVFQSLKFSAELVASFIAYMGVLSVVAQVCSGLYFSSL